MGSRPQMSQVLVDLFNRDEGAIAFCDCAIAFCDCSDALIRVADEVVLPWCLSSLDLRCDLSANVARSVKSIIESRGCRQ